VSERATRLSILSALLIVAGCRTQQVEPTFPQLKAVYSELLFIMGDSRSSRLDRLQASYLLARGDQAAIPVLIHGLDDSRVFDNEATRANGSPWEPPISVTVGEQCEELLYSVIARPPYGRYSVKSWDEWWSTRKEWPLERIQCEVRDAGVLFE